MAHEAIDGMRQGGSGRDRHDPVVTRAWLVGTLMLSTMVALFAYGFARGPGRGPEKLLVVVGLLLVNVTFSGLMVSYRRFLDVGALELWLGLPRPTAWMFLVFWLSQLSLYAAFLGLFRRSFWNREKAAAFQEILRERRGHGATG